MTKNTIHENEQTTRFNKSVNDVTNAIQLKLNERMNKSRFEMIVTLYSRNKNVDKKIAGPVLKNNLTN